MNNNNQEYEKEQQSNNGENEVSTKEMSVILQILALEKQNNKSTKKLSQQEIVNKILGIIRREVENEIH